MRIRLFLCLFCMGLVLSRPIQAQETKTERPRIGVVLSGGGAKGMAHIGVLSVLEEMGIPVDVIAGTSIGSLVGGLYALGYDAQTLDSLVRVQDWDFLLSDRLSTREQNLATRQRQETYIYSLSLSGFHKKGLSNAGLIQGQNLANLFTRLSVGYHDSIDFTRDLPIPFACVATDMVKFQEVDFTSGYISQAMRASMSIPAAFSPVRKDSMVLVDGGLMNNYPADLARKLGADVIIGVSLQKEKTLTASDIVTTGDIVNQLINVNTKNKYAENWDATDVKIRVNVEGFGTASFTTRAVDSLILRGRQAALAHRDELIALRNKVLGSDSICYQRPAGRKLNQTETKIHICDIEFSNVAHGDERFLRQHFNLNHTDSLTISEIESIITMLRGSLFYQDATYTLSDQSRGKQLTITARGKKACIVSVGARFDNESKAALQLSALLPLRTRLPLTLEATGRLGESSMGRLQASLSLEHQGSVNVSYQYWHRDVDVYHEGNKAFNTVLRNHQIDLSVAGMQVRNLLFDLVARVDRVDYDIDLGGGMLVGDDIDDQTLLSYHARLRYDSQDRTYFATRGSRFRAEYGLYTTNGIHYRKHTPISTITASWQTNLKLSRRFVLQPIFYGRGVTSHRVPTFLRNYVGGPWFGHYVEQQLPLAGVSRIEAAQPYFAAIQISGREQILPKHYALLSLSGASQSDDCKKILQSHNFIGGVQVGYAYDSPLGPASLSVGYSSLTDKLSVYLNLGYHF